MSLVTTIINTIKKNIKESRKYTAIQVNYK